MAQDLTALHFNEELHFLKYPLKYFAVFIINFKRYPFTSASSRKNKIRINRSVMELLSNIKKRN